MSVPKATLLTHLDYTAWATSKLLDACASLTADQMQRDLGSSHGGVLGTLRHIYYGDAIWIARLEERGETFQTPQPEPALDELQRDWPAVWQRFRSWLEALPEEQLLGELHARRLNGEAFHLERWKVLLHVVNHGTLHRGQVMSLLRQLQSTPPATDLFFYYLAKQA